VGALAVACGARESTARAEINLIALLPGAERRALAPVDAAIRIAIAGPAGDRRVGLVVDAPARITWSHRLAPRSRLLAAFALVDGAPEDAVTLRIGVSDPRTYEGLFSRRLEAGSAADASWQPLDLDLSAYGGWQWSLFYRPWNTTWRINLSVDATPHGAVAIDRLRIETGR
jgi:hypothetical protein